MIRTAIRTAHPADTPDGSKDIYIGPDGKVYVRTSAGVLRRLDHDGLGMEKYQHKHSGGNYTNTWIIPNKMNGSTVTTTALTDQVLYGVPWPICTTMTVSDIAIYVSTAGSGGAGLCHLLIYHGIDEDDDGPLRGLDIYPGALLLNAGTVDVTTTGEKKITGLAVPLEEGRLYFGALLVECTTPPSCKSLTITNTAALAGMDSAWAGSYTGINPTAVTTVPDPFTPATTPSAAGVPVIAIRRSA